MAPSTGVTITGKSPGPQVPQNTNSSSRALRTDTNKPRPTRAEIEKQQSSITSAESGREYLEKTALTIIGEPYDTESISTALFHVTQLPNITIPIRDAIRAIAYIILHMGKKHAAEDIITSIESAIEASTDRLQTLMETSLKTNLDILNTAHTTLESAAGNFKQMTREITEHMAETTNKAAKGLTEASTQLTVTATKATPTPLNYREALLAGSGGAGQHYLDQLPAEVRAQAREAIRARQVLLDLKDRDDTQAANPAKEASAAETVERANKALKSMITDESDQFVVRNATRLRNGGILLEFNSSEAAAWIRKADNKHKFTERFDPERTMKERNYTLVVPFVPLTFSPDSDKDLREIEETSDLPTGTIIKARWIKPPNRREKTQLVGHVMITLSTPESANQALLKGLQIRNKKVQPQKNRKEPTRCLKCQRYGHIAASCQSIQDVCGTCGHTHRTADCDRAGETWCVSCGTDNHSSWDRECPSFEKCCEELDERYRENSMPFFPTGELWTMVSEPQRTRTKNQRKPSQQDQTRPQQDRGYQPTLRQTKLPYQASQRTGGNLTQRRNLNTHQDAANRGNFTTDPHATR